MDNTETQYNLENINTNINLLNEIYSFREKHNMEEDCILDVLTEFAHHNNLDVDLMTRELSDIQGFQDLVEIDMVKFKFKKPDDTQTIQGWGEE